MTFYTCKNCKKNFKRKDYLTKHLNRKFPCKRVENHKNCDLGKSPVSLNGLTGKSPVSLNGLTGKSLFIESESSNNSLNICKSIDKNDKKKYKCDYCNKEYSHKQSKYKHQKKCKNIQKNVKKEQNIVKKDDFFIKNENNFKKIFDTLKKNNKSLVLIKNRNNEETIKIKNTNNINEEDIVLNNEIDNNTTNIRGCYGEGVLKLFNNTISCTTTNNTNTTNNNIINNTNIINISLNPFGKENLTSITKEEKIKTLNKMYLGLPAMLKQVHYDIPDNTNFFLANKNNKKFITYYDGEEFIYEHSNKFKDKLCMNLMEHLEEWFNEYQNQLLKNKKSTLRKVFTEYYNGKLDEKYNKEIDKYLLSYSDNIKTLLKNTIKCVKSKTIQKLNNN